jgi:NAD-dependent SIR2 family protein deacetylase
MEKIDQIRECNWCQWIGWGDDCVSHEHQKSLLLCPECKQTTFLVTPEYVLHLRDKTND